MIGLIDGGNFYRRCIHSVNATTKFWDSMMMYDRFSQAVDEIISVLDSTNILMALDAGTSWRKAHLVEYKAKRKLESEINWDMVRNAQKDFTKNLIKHKCNVSFAYDLEADDVIYGWTNKLKDAEDIVIFSADKDLNQLLFQNAKRFCIQIDLIQRVVYIPENPTYIENYIFNKFVLKLKTVFEFKIVYINAFNTLLEKVLCGDKSDEIPSIYDIQKETKAGVRTYRFTEAKMHKALDSLNLNSKDLNDMNFKRTVIQGVGTALENLVNLNILQKNYESNVKMVYLHESSYPMDVYKKLQTILEKPLTIFNHEEFKHIDKATMVKEQKGFNAAYWTKFVDLDIYINGGIKPDLEE
jgi:5'-3' exonuclease